MAANHRTDNRPINVSPARLVAIGVLHRIATQDAYASLALDAEIDDAKLDARDAALATEIVYGTLRVLPELDSLISAHLEREGSRLDPLTHAALRASCYQLRHLGRVPPHAIVDDAVSLVSSRRSRALGGFVNALLRKIAEQRPQDPQPPSRLSLAPWLQQSLSEALPAERFAAFVHGRPLPPPLGLRVNPRRIRREKLAELTAGWAPQAEVAVGALSPLALVVRRAGDPRRLPGFGEGLFSVQEEGAQLVGLSIGSEPGDRVADACAGHGGKTVLIASLVGEGGSNGRVTAIDMDEDKLANIPAEMNRLGLDPSLVETLAVDLSVGTGGLGPTFNRVLVDAPCTGVGTIHRRPELLIRLEPRDPARFSELQLSILQGAVKLVRPSGLLVYSVCSPLPEEGALVASRMEACHSRLRRTPPPRGAGLPPPDPDGITRIGPWLAPGSPSSPDVYQIIQWIVA